MSLNLDIREFSWQVLNGMPKDNLIGCFQKVFAGPPWNERWLCPECGENYGDNVSLEKDRAGKREFLICPDCSWTLEKFWPHDRVQQLIKEETSGKTAAFRALDIPPKGRGICKTLGFCWGYPISLPDLEERLEVSINWEAIGMHPTEMVAYQSQLGVIRQCRDRGIGKQLFAARLEKFQSWDGILFTTARVRRDPEPSKTYLWYTDKLGYEAIAEYEDGRVILGRRLAGLQEKL